MTLTFIVISLHADDLTWLFLTFHQADNYKIRAYRYLIYATTEEISPTGANHKILA